ncbi:TonB-dependent receptor [Sphingomonas sp. BGYR3]|uniref:TonB-dependent receptor domain-containing protein n=1 Tax=Sphingomonas sp. BGYR3 TaxID=2975483 RepID=UPI0021A6C9A9|nr:TonB-dependent receptor [Sphingomonas sp. BGYR3]MDG5489568.1 TonB-dependent receptor [Sphingomonas sp. BGYR3]
MRLSRFLTATALASAAFTIPQVAWAQETTEPETQQGDQADETDEDGADDRIIVTGSRISRPEFTGILPGVQVTGEQIQARGFTNVLEAINDIPLVGPGASPLNGNNGGQAASLGAGFIDLLDLGTQRTLTLVNGRRYVSGNAASLFVDANATGSQVDVNSIPSSLVERVDVVTVGGAAAYGSDAIAGVVNFILKDDYEGAEFRALAGISERGDAGQYQLNGLVGKNFLDGDLNVTVSAEYTRSDGLQADARDFRLRRAGTIANYLNGATRNSAFAPAIIDVVGSNNGAFLRNSDDGQPGNAFGEGFINQSLSFAGTILNTLGTPATPYVPNASRFITLQNGIGATGLSFFNTGAQLVNGLPGVPLTLGTLNGNGLNGRTTPIANLPITTFAPTALPAGVTAAQVFAQFNVTPPAGATAGQLNTLAINVLQANRPTAREFFAANPTVPVNAFIGTFIPGVPRVANTDTRLVTVAGVQVPLNQVLPFVAVPLEFNDDGSIRNYTAATLNPTTQGTFGQAPGSNGGFVRAIENTVLRTQQDRFIGNFIASWKIAPDITLFTENLYSKVINVSLRNAPSQNFLATGAENAALVLNVNNPYLDAADRAALNAVGINATTRGGSFVLTRQNQDIFGDNPFRNEAETYRLLVGARSNFRLFGQDWNAEVSATYGRADQVTKTTNINDIEYQLALDAVDEGVARTGVANGNIVCRAQVFPGQYLGFTPTGTVANLTKQPGSDGLPTEVVITPTITQAMIDGCRPLNPFGYNQMSEASKAYVRQDVEFFNTSKQTFVQGTVSGGLFDLPAGTLEVAISGEYRKDELAFTSSALNQLGRSRTAPSATTNGYIEASEVGAEARIPVIGEDFLSFLGTLTLEPAVRFSKQNGAAESYRNLAGNVVNPRSSGDWQTIYTLGGTWAPIRDITIRGNYTQSIRQPGVVELFLGGQPAFAAPTDPCGPTQINAGTTAAQKRANCRTAVINAGLANDATTADAFLATFVPNAAALPGSFSGATTLQPERGSSWTVGAVAQPRFIPGLTLGADYISLDLDNVIQPTTLAQALQFCYDSPTFPDTGPQTGSNTCTFFNRNNADFQVAPGFSSGYINLAATEVRAVNINGRYVFDLPSNIGRIDLQSNVFHYIRYTSSAAGNFADAVESAGTFNRPKWRARSSIRYSTEGGFFGQVTWNWQAATNLFVSGQPGTIEDFPNVRLSPTNLIDLTLGADVNENFRLQFNINNVTDQNYAGETGLFAGAFIDQIGRRFQASARVRF